MYLLFSVGEPQNPNPLCKVKHGRHRRWLPAMASSSFLLTCLCSQHWKPVPTSHLLGVRIKTLMLYRSIAAGRSPNAPPASLTSCLISDGGDQPHMGRVNTSPLQSFTLVISFSFMEGNLYLHTLVDLKKQVFRNDLKHKFCLVQPWWLSWRRDAFGWKLGLKNPVFSGL